MLISDSDYLLAAALLMQADNDARGHQSFFPSRQKPHVGANLIDFNALFGTNYTKIYRSFFKGHYL
jgi:hypothetical protein